MRTKICAELATGHGGNLGTARAMIQAAAQSGCSAVKIQHYGAVNPNDPQADWLNQSRLHYAGIDDLMDYARGLGLEFWATPFDAATLLELETLGVDRIKIASSEARNDWWRDSELLPFVVSWPWGKKEADCKWDTIHLCAVPLYPTPLECVQQTEPLDGWSDHTVGLAACMHAIAYCDQWIEAHLTLPGVSREKEWDKTPADFKTLRQFADDVETMRSGVGQVFRDRWTA